MFSEMSKLHTRTEVISKLYKKLAKLRGYEWQKAQMIMNEISAHKGHGHMVVPRVCKRCDHFGHTKQFCPVTDPEIVRFNQEMKGYTGAYGWVKDYRDAFSEVSELDLPPCVNYHPPCHLRGLPRCKNCVSFHTAYIKILNQRSLTLHE